MLLVVFGLLVVQIVTARLSVAVIADVADLQPNRGVGFLLAFLTAPSLAGIGWVWFHAVWREPLGWQRFTIQPISGAWIAISLLSAVACVFIAAAIAKFSTPFIGPPAGPPLPIRPGEAVATASFVSIFLLSAGLLAPVMEELVFRGVLYVWARRFMGVLPAALIAAAIHALVHFDLGATPSLIVIFVVFAWLYERSGTIWAPIIAHAGHNLIVSVLMFAGLVE